MSEDQVPTEAVSSEPVAEGTLTGTVEPASDWRTSLSEDVAAHSAIKDIKTVEDLAKATINAQKMVGADKVVIPTKDQGREAWDEVYNKLGRPEKPEGYQLPEDGMPENMPLDEAAMGDLRSAAHSLGMNKQQFAGLVRYMAEKSAENQESRSAAMEHSREEAVAELRSEFGAAFDQNVTMARDAVEKFGGDSLKQVLDKTGLGNHPEVVKAFAKVGRLIAEDEIIGRGSRAGFTMTPQEAQAQIQMKQGDREFMKAYTTSHDPGHASAVAEMTKLFELVHGSE